MRKRHTTLLLTGALLLAACSEAADLDVAVAPDVRGAPLGVAVPEKPVIEQPAATDETAATARQDEPVAAGPAEPETGAAAQDPSSVVVPGASDSPDNPPDTPLDAAPEVLGDLPTSDQQTSTGDAPVESDPADDVAEDLGVVETAEEWTPPVAEKPVKEDGVWKTTFAFLGDWDLAMMALPEGSALAQHTQQTEPAAAEGEAKGDGTIPDDVLALADEMIDIEGYMIPLEFEEGKVRSFFLSRYMMGCCFGVIPKANEVIRVQMTNEDGAFYDAYMPIIVTGKLRILPDGSDDKYLKTIYTMKSEAVRWSEDW